MMCEILTKLTKQKLASKYSVKLGRIAPPHSQDPSEAAPSRPPRIEVSTDFGTVNPSWNKSAANRFNVRCAPIIVCVNHADNSSGYWWGGEAFPGT